MGTLGLGGKSQTGGLHRVVLDMEQVGRMVGAEMLFGVGDERLGFVAGNLADGDRPTVQPLIEGLAPGFGVALWGVLFQQQEVGNRFDGH